MRALVTLGLLGALASPAHGVALAAESFAVTTDVAPATTPVPFTCEPKLYQSATQSATPGPRLYVYDPVSNSYSTVGSDIATGGPNGMGYNTADGFIYANNYGDLMRIDANGTYTDVGDLVYNGNRLGDYNSGDFWGPDRLLIGKNNSNAWLSVDVSDPTNPVITDFPLTGDTFGPLSADFTVLGNTAYGLSPNGSSPMILSVVNLSTQVVVNKLTSGATAGTDQGVGAAYADALGNVYFHRNRGSVYRILAEDLDDPNPLVTSMGPAPTAPGGGTLTPANDGASCPDAASAFSSTIINEAASSITDTSAAVTADVNPNGVSTTAVICYGTSSATSGGALQGCTSTASPTNADDTIPLTGTSSVSLNPLTVSGLSPRTTYYWQVVTTSAATTTYGSVASFTTTGAPVVTTQPASSVTTTSASVSGIVNPGGLSTTVSFCYGTASDLTGCTPQAATQSPLAVGSADQAVSASLTGLTPGTTYYVRVSAANSDGTVDGTIRSFTTSAVPSVTLNSTTAITSTDARLNATVNPKGLATSVAFCFGTTADLSGCTSVSAAESPLVGVDASLATTADLTGLTPATTYYVRATATNSNGSVSSNDDSFTTDPTPLVLTTTTGSLPTGIVGAAYSKALVAAGGVEPYSWSVTSGALPTGLTQNSVTGEISGTPSVTGDFTFTISVTDGNAQTDSRSFAISVVDRPAVTANAASSIGTTSAVLNGSVNPGALVTTAEFCLSDRIDMSGCTVISVDQSPLAASTSASAVSTTVSGLAPGTTYYARVQAANSAGGGVSSVVSFATLSAPVATTGAATFRDKTTNEAILNATVDAMGSATTVSFCWGTTPTLVGCTSGSATASPVADDSGTINVSRTVGGLSLGAVYYFNVTATNAAGTTVGSTVEFTMPTSTAPTPTITSVSPNTGDAAGGESVTINGTNFSTTGIGVTVSIGGVDATVTSTTAGAITVTTPPGITGAADVIVSNNDGQAVRATNAYTYTSAAFAVSYDGNGATGGAAPVDGTGYTRGSSATVASAGTLVRGGHTFLGWNTAANGSGTTVLAGSLLTVTSDVTLYAQWQANLSVSSTSLDFGSRATDAGASPAQTITVTNASPSTVSILASGISVGGSTPADFAISGGTCAPSGVIATGASCTIQVTFEPSAAGARSASVAVATTAGSVTVTLTGTGTAPTPTPTPTPDPQPAPVVPADPPRDVTATPGDGQVTVSWRPPADTGTFALTHYQLSTTPAGGACLVEASQTSCVIDGLSNGLTYTVRGRALTGAGWSDWSAPSGPVTPTATPDALPEPDPLPGPVPPGSFTVTIDGDVDPEAKARFGVEDGKAVISSGRYTVDVQALDQEGEPRPLGKDNRLQPVVGERVNLSGDGFHPSTYAAVYVHTDGGDLGPDRPDDPVIVGAVLVDKAGQFTASWPLPDEVSTGDYVLQVVGTTTALRALSANVGMSVIDAGTPSIAIVGQRGTTRSTARIVYAAGRTEGLDGLRVRARVKLPGQMTYSRGSQRTVQDGAFEWKRRTGKQVRVYFQAVTLVGDRVRSQRIVIPKAQRPSR